MKNSLSIRSYTKNYSSHSHDYHQMVLTLCGHIDIEVEEYKGKVSVGEAITIKANEVHNFRANEEARFIVADILSLPTNMNNSSKRKFPISRSLLSFIQFAEHQLEGSTSTSIEKKLYDLFFELLLNEPMIAQIDKRIENAVAFIHEDLSLNHSIADLSGAACLGQTQFKKIFKDCIGTTVSNYLIKVRMEKARSLLTYTDFPVSRIALDVGYSDPSAFTRRFTQYFSQPPSHYKKYQ